MCVLVACSEGQGNSKSKSGDGGEGASLQTVEITRGQVSRIISATGKINPRQKILVGSEVSGRVLEVAVDFNSQVKAGDLLATIDQEKFQNTLEQLRGQLRSSEADVRVQEASVNRAEVNLRQTEKAYSRQSDLFAQEAVSEARLEEVERSLGTAKADLALAQARLESAKAGIAQIKARIRNANADLERTIIKSPIDGVIIERKIDPGQTVQASFSAPELFVIAADLTTMQVEAKIVESDVAGLDQGDKVKFTVDAYPDRIFEGEVDQLRYMSATENNIVTYVAIVSADNADGTLLPGMTANLDITVDVREDAMRLPVSVERFRPTPDQIAAWEDPDAVAEAPGLLDQVFDRMKRANISQDDIDEFKSTMDKSAKPIIDIINDPEKSFMHTPMKIRLTEMTNNVLKNQLSQSDFFNYNNLLNAEKTIRLGELWVVSASDKMKKVPVKFGLSDNAFVELVSGLDPEDKVVSGIKSGEAGPK